jgi:signal peptidase I
MIAIVVVAAFVVRTYVIEPFQVPSASMEKTIMTGDMVFAEKVSYKFSKPQQGDVVVFSDPQISSRTLIKRVIATEGQVVDLRGGTVYVDGVAQKESYTDGLPSYPLTTVGNVSISYPYTVPKGMVWVMGDNRTNSSDSRYFGPIDTATVFGKAFAIYWPIESMAWL